MHDSPVRMSEQDAITHARLRNEHITTFVTSIQSSTMKQQQIIHLLHHLTSSRHVIKLHSKAAFLNAKKTVHIEPTCLTAGTAEAQLASNLNSLFRPLAWLHSFAGQQAQDAPEKGCLLKQQPVHI